jgi:phage tail-like protein
MLAEAPERTGRVDLTVEAGGTLETTLTLAPARADGVLAPPRLSGIPSSWYTLSVPDEGPSKAGQRVHVRLVLHPPRLEHGGTPGDYDVEIEVEGAEAQPSAWRLRLMPPGTTELERGVRVPRSRLVEFLPRHYRTDEFLGRFLLIFQTALDTIEQSIDTTHLLLDPGLTPPELLEWLGSWLDLDLSSVTDVQTRRTLIERAIELYRWKGTRRGLRSELALRLNVSSLIVENFDGLRLGHDAALGVNTQLGRRLDSSIVVTLGLPPAHADDEVLDKAAELIDATRPASCAYVVRLAPSSHTATGGD